MVMRSFFFFLQNDFFKVVAFSKYILWITDLLFVQQFSLTLEVDLDPCFLLPELLRHWPHLR